MRKIVISDEFWLVSVSSYYGKKFRDRKKLRDRDKKSLSKNGFPMEKRFRLTDEEIARKYVLDVLKKTGVKLDICRACGLGL